MMGERKSNKQVGAENLARLAAWLEQATLIPERAGKANISGISVASGVDRQVLYRPEAMSLIEEAVTKKGLGMPEQQRGPAGDPLPSWATQRIKDLEESLAISKAEAHELRERLRCFEHLEAHLATTGLLAR